MRNCNITLKIFLVFITLGFTNIIKAQEVENEFQTRAELKLTTNLLKGVKVSLTPMARFNDNLKFDQYLLEGELVYKPFKLFSIGTAYRYIGNKTKNDGTEHYGRYTFYGEMDKEYGRLKPSLRISYTNYSDDDAGDKYLRYKAGLDYNLSNSKFTPEIGFEVFHDLTNSEIYKIRYSAGIDYKLFKNNTIGLGYKLDYYMQDPVNKHIIGVGYKIKF